MKSAAKKPVGPTEPFSRAADARGPGSLSRYTPLESLVERNFPFFVIS